MPSPALTTRPPNICEENLTFHRGACFASFGYLVIYDRKSNGVIHYEDSHTPHLINYIFKQYINIWEIS